MKKELANIKSLIDFAVAKGLFNDAESVGTLMDSYRQIAHACYEYELAGDRGAMKVAEGKDKAKTA